MDNIEKNISPLIENMFPAFYKTEGPNFIAFVKAYFEWLESDGTYTDPSNNSVIIYNDTANTIPAGNQAIHQARRLLSYRDIDSTVDEYIIHFKEKYLKNIQFNTATNKKLLIKNSYDLYRSKGTQRSIDLFFKLVYGVTAEIYYPGDDIFRLSDGVWTKPYYLEVTSTTRSIDLVGKQITGVTSGSTAFVEKYIKRRIQGSVVDILYISNISGQFINGESLRAVSLYPDAPKVIGSLSKVDIVTGGKLFSVGDTVSFVSSRGNGGLARVASVSDKTGVVDFLFIDGGWGYTTSANSIVSEKVLTLSNVSTTNTSYFKLLEQIKQPLANVQFDTAVGTFAAGDHIFRYVTGSVVATGKILAADQATTTGNLFISITSGTFPTNSILYTTSNTKHANIAAYADQTASAKVMGIPSSAVMSLISASGIIPYDIECYQSNTSTEFANGYVDVTILTGGKIDIQVSNVQGAFVPNRVINFRNSAITANVDTVELRVGIYGISNTFVATEGAYVYTGNTGTTANVSAVSFGFGAKFSVGTIGETETIFINTDLLGANNAGYIAANAMVMANQAFMTLPINNYAYGFSKSPQGNSADVIYSCLTFLNFQLGTIGTITGIDPGADYNTDPFVLAYQPYIAGFNRRDYKINIENITTSFSVGEKILQTSESLIQYILTVGSTTGFALGELVVQGTANGVISTISTGTNQLVIDSVQGTFSTSGNVKSYINPTTNSAVSVATLSALQSTAKGIVKENSNSSVLLVERITFNNTFKAPLQIVGQSSGATANIVGVVEDLSSIPIGLNANIAANVVTANGTVISLEVTDSGFGYSNATLLQFVSEDGQRVGDAKSTINGYGTGSGYYNSSKGFLSDNKYVHDSEYYQEYSYEVMTKLPFDLYSEMFKKVMHTAGTKVFGSVVVVQSDLVTVSKLESNNEFANTNAVVFNANSDVNNTSEIITGNNAFTNGDLIITENHPVRYYTPTHIATFNTNTGVNGATEFITITDNVLVNNEVVTYSVPIANTAIPGLGSGNTYYVVWANTLGLALSLTSGGANINITASADIETHLLIGGVYLPIGGLVNNHVYFAADATATGFKLRSNPRTDFTYSFNSNTSVSSNFIALTRHNFANGDAVKYYTAVGNTALTGLANNTTYFVISANSSGVKLTSTTTGSAITLTKSVTENGHFITSNTIINLTASTANTIISNNHTLIYE
jgi:hypothetical protein